LLRERRKKIATAAAARTARPPTTPPTIAPVFDFFFFGGSETGKVVGWEIALVVDSGAPEAEAEDAEDTSEEVADADALWTIADVLVAVASVEVSSVVVVSRVMKYGAEAQENSE
jgi:hypothetical protein